MRQKNRIEEVDLLRGLAAILMIFGRLFIVYPIGIAILKEGHTDWMRMK